MKKAAISHEESIQQNLEKWCYEVGTEYEQRSVNSAKRFIEFIGKQPVADLGCGDGAATKVFIKNGNPTTAVDINPTKLEKVLEGTKKKNMDFVTYLTLEAPHDNIFMHHSLEHYSEPEKVLELIAKHLKTGRYAYIAVPKNEGVQSVHHTSFESLDELKPDGLTVVKSWEEVNTDWAEYIVILRKDLK